MENQNKIYSGTRNVAQGFCLESWHKEEDQEEEENENK